MAHNDEATGSGGGVLRSVQLTYDEADVLYWHGWHVSNTGFAVPSPPPAVPEMRTLINKLRKHMTPVERNMPAHALNSPFMFCYFIKDMLSTTFYVYLCS
jgi:hypothetical protein